MTFEKFKQATRFLNWEHITEEDMSAHGMIPSPGGVDSGHWDYGKAGFIYWRQTDTLSMNNADTWLEIPMGAIEQADAKIEYGLRVKRIISFSVRWTLHGNDGAITFHRAGGRV